MCYKIIICVMCTFPSYALNKVELLKISFPILLYNAVATFLTFKYLSLFQITSFVRFLELESLRPQVGMFLRILGSSCRGSAVKESDSHP